MASPFVGPAGVTSGLAAWYKIDSVSSTDGTAVATWADSSPNGYDLAQGTGSLQPLYQTNEVNGLACLEFDGTDDYLVNTAAAFDVAQPFTVYQVLKQRTWTDTDWIWDSNTASEAGLLQLGTTPGVQIWAGSSFVATNSHLTLDTWAVVTVIFNGASSSVRVDHATANRTPTTGNPGTTGIENGFVLGAQKDFSSASAISVAEWICYSGSASAGDQTSVRAYLGTKYGITVA
jgi:hypothetical protein